MRAGLIQAALTWDVASEEFTLLSRERAARNAEFLRENYHIKRHKNNHN